MIGTALMVCYIALALLAWPILAALIVGVVAGDDADSFDWFVGAFFGMVAAVFWPVALVIRVVARAAQRITEETKR